MHRFFRIRAIFLAVFLFVPTAGAFPAMRIGLLPAGDSLLLVVAREEGLFKKYDLDIELVPFVSSLEQGTALLAGKLDGVFTDPVRVLLLNETGANQKIVASTFHTSPGCRYFGLAVSPQVEIGKLSESRGMTTGISTHTIIEYIYDRMLEEEKMTREAFQTVNIDKIPIRLQMLMTGRLESAILPEPLLSLAEKMGAQVLWDDRHLNTALAVVTLDAAIADGSDGTAVVSGLQEALKEAAIRINADPDRYRTVMLEKKLLPAALADSYRMLSFDLNFVPQPPRKKDLEHYATWMRERGLLKQPFNLSDIVK